MIKWVTDKIATDAATKGLRPAIDMSAQKWWNYGFCTQAKFNKTLAQWRNLNLGADFQLCALCVYVKDGCKDCLLCKDQGLDCNEESSLYYQAKELLYDYDDNPTKTNFDKFQAKAQELWRIIKNLKEKE